MSPAAREFSPISYFGDLAALFRAGLADEAMHVLARFCDIAGFQLNAGKSSVGNEIAILGLLGPYPSMANEGHLPISLPGGNEPIGHIC